MVKDLGLGSRASYSKVQIFGFKVSNFRVRV